jgi:MFS transporter, SIT family, siderophore-iron:H+ symporter
LIYTLCATPLLATLFYASHRAKRSGALDNYRTPFQQMGMTGLSKALFWQLDVIGIILLIAFLSLILVPFTIAGGAETKWKQGHIIAMLVVGVCCVPLFVWWEMRAPHPVIPFPLLRDRGVWAGLGMAMFLNFSWYLQGE